jgi:hypothetical protein
MSKEFKSRVRWYSEYNDVGYALGKEVMFYLIFEKRSKKEVDLLWAEYIEPYGDDSFKIRFVEEGDLYTFVMYREPFGETSFGFCKGGFDAKGLYSKFRKEFEDKLLLSYGFSDDGTLRLSERYKIISDVKFMHISEVDKNPIVSDAIGSHEKSG